MKNSISVIIHVLSGRETALNARRPWSLHQICGRSMLQHAVFAACQLTDTPPLVLAEEDRERVQEHLDAAVAVTALPEISTAYEWLKTYVQLAGDNSTLFLLPGNRPLVTKATLQSMILNLDSNQLDALIMSPSKSLLTGIRPEHQVCCFSLNWLEDALAQHKDHLKSIPLDGMDIPILLNTCEGRYDIFQPADTDEFLTVNDHINLATAEARMRQRINEGHMINGVTFIDPNQTYIGSEVVIGPDTLLYPGNVLEGCTVIGQGCILYPNNRVHNSIIGDEVTLQSSVVLDSSVGRESTVGPYAYIRPGSDIGSHVRIGDFVEIKKSVIGKGTKVSHLTYIGDAQLGEDVNIGCGVVSVNYDGKRKQKVIIGDHAFVGCNVNLIAPVEVENHAYVAAGSTITERVPAKALAIARTRQVNKEGWVDKRERIQQRQTEEK